jgi:hypothetical protein
MNLSSIQLVWLAVGCAIALVIAVVMGLLRTKKPKHSASAAADDSWERSEERRRRKEALYGSASYVLLFACASVAAALSFHGLVGFGRENLNLTGGWEYLVPFGLDGAAMFCSVLAVREASHGDAALGSRMLVWLFAGASACFNWVHAPRGGDHNGAPQFFAGMSLSAAVLFDRALKQTRRAALREQGLVPRPLPQIRMVRWLRAPIETYQAWSLMLLENVRTLDDAVEEVREDKREREAAAARQRSENRRERAELKAISRSAPLRELTTLEASGNAETAAALEPASPLGLTGRRRRSEALPAAAPVSYTSAEEEPLPRLDSLEKKLKDLEQQFG